MKKSLKRLLSAILCFTIIVSGFITAIVTSAATVDVWDGTEADSYAGGTGTGSDPYLIATPEQLARMIGYDVLTNPTDKITNGSTGKYYKLTADIYLNDVSDANWYTKTGLKEWYSSTASRFCGNFDGNGYTIRGLHFASDATCTGLFPNIDAWAADRYFTNIKIADSYISGSSYAGAIVGYINSGNNKNVYLKNCYVDDTVIIVGGNNASGFIGAVAYENSYYTVENSASLAVNPNGSKLQYGFIGNNHSWNWGCKYVSVTNSFAYANAYLGAAWGVGIKNSYLISDLASIKGDAAKTAMPDLDWKSVWQTNEGNYPTYRQNSDIASDVWQGDIANNYSGGTGTADDPYLIATPEQLARMIGYDVLTNYSDVIKNGSNGKYYKLISDIYLNDISSDTWYNGDKLNSWYTGTSSYFLGNFNGNGHTIYGLYFPSDTEYAGLFPYISGWNSDITIKNLTVSNSYIRGKYAGGIAGRCNSGQSHTFYFEKCYITNSVIIEGTSTGTNNDYPFAGGFIGYTASGEKTKHSFTSCASLAKNKDGSYLKYGFIGLNATWSMTVYYTLYNSFAYAEAYHGTKNAEASVTDSYKVTDLESITGSSAKITMPDLDWKSVWQTNEGNYPTYRQNSDIPSDVWQGDVASGYSGGTGTVANPYQIATPEELAYMVSVDTATEGNYYVLTNDIKLNDIKDSAFNACFRWYDSNTAKLFKGNLDGRNHIVSGMYYSASASSNLYTALIPKTGEGAYICNIILTESEISVTSSLSGDLSSAVGGILGYNYGKSIVKDCYVDETVMLKNTRLSTENNSNCTVGGILGGGESDIIIDSCAFFGKIVHTDGAKFGGMFGDVWSGSRTISNSICAEYTPSSARTFGSTNNVFEIRPDSNICSDGFTVSQLKGEESIEAIKNLNSNGRYFATYGYPKLSALARRFNDVNGDSITNSEDLIAIKKYLLGTSKLGYIDINNDSENNIKDLVAIKKIVAGFYSSNPVYYSLYDADVINKIKVMGRYETDNGISLNWTASTLDFNIYGGGTITADIIYNAFSNKAASGYNKIYFTVYVDGVRQSRRLCLSGSSNGEAQNIVIAEDIQIGSHNIQIVRQTEAYFGTVDVTGLSFAGYFTERTSDSLLVEFVGDSITVGMGNLGKNGDHSQPITQQPDFQDGTQAYAYITAKNLGVDYRIVSRTGIGAAYGWSNGEDSNFLECYNYQNIFADNYNNYKPDREADILCINLGTNDKWCGKCPDDATLTQKYIELINLIKKYNPSVKKTVFIVGGINNSYLQAVKVAVASLGGEVANYYLCQTSSGLTAGEQGHPDVGQHKTLSDEVTAFLREKVIADEDLSMQISPVFSDNMILQRNQKICVYGTGYGSGTVTLGNQTKEIISTGGEWKIYFDPIEASTIPIKFKATLSNRNISFENVLVGDVYLTSGQSNMELTVADTEHNNNGNYANRILRFKNRDASDWKEFTNTNVAALSAISTLFAQDLANKLENNIPIGIISTAVGASRIEDWTAKDYCTCDTDINNLHSDAVYYDQGDHELFDTYIKPLACMSVAGVLWYQGESNRGIGEAYKYYDKFQNMVNCWRNYFGRADLPFYTVQIMLYSNDNSVDRNGNAADEYNIRIAQGEAARTIPYVTVCTLLSLEDTLLPDGTLNIHPTDKAPVAQALVNAAISNYYIKNGDYSGLAPEYSGPLYDNVTVNGNTATVTFNHTAEGLMLTSGNVASEFEVRDSDGSWKTAKATVDGTSVILTADVSEITGVRMGYRNKPSINLYNTINGQRGYCASPFVWTAD